MSKTQAYRSRGDAGESLSPKLGKMTKKSFFVESSPREEAPTRDSELTEKPQKLHKSRKGRRHSSEKDHTVVDIIDEGPKPVSQKLRHEVPRASSRKPREKELKESIIRNRSVESSSGGSDTETDRESEVVIQEDSDTSVKKTTTALLLANENETLMGSSISRDGNLWNVLAFKEPRQESTEEIENYRKLIYLPSSNPVPEDEKPEDVEAGGIGNDGLFAGEPAKTSASNRNRLERRLLTEDLLEWFGPDGHLLSFPDPYRTEIVQLFLEDQEKEEEFKKKLVFAPARLHELQELKIDPTQKYEIEVDLGFVKFSHHPLFSKEHVIAAALEKDFEEYSLRRTKRVTERAVNKLKALREAISHTKSTIDKLRSELEKDATNSNGHRSEYTSQLKQHRDRLLRYRKEVKRCTLARDKGYWEDKGSITSVLETWKNLKKLREDQGHTNTSLKVSIMELPVDPREDQEVWMKEMKEDLQDIEEENEEHYEIEMAKFRAKTKKWKERKAKKTKVNSEEETSEEDSPSSRRPRLPQKPDIDEVKRALEKRYREMRRIPGDPLISLELTYTAPITPNNQLPDSANAEKKRRKGVKSSQVEVHIWFNAKEIFISKPRDVGQDFSAFLGFKVPICISEWPELLEVQVVETGIKMTTPVIHVSLPSSKETIERCPLQKLPFLSDAPVKPSQTGVGSGSPFEIMGKQYEAVKTSGVITLRCGWTVNKDGVILCPTDFKGQILLNDDQSESRKLSDTSQLDPNDPKNMERPKVKVEEAIIDNEKDELEDLNEAVEHPKGTEQITDFDFCSMESIDRSSRLRALEMRDKGIREFRNLKMIPLDDKEISMDPFQAYERRLKSEKKRLVEGTDKNLMKLGRKRMMDDDFVYESNRLEKIKEMRINVLQIFESSLRQITFEDMVIEEQIPDIGTLGLNLMQFFQPRRPLRPIRKERKRFQASNLVDTKIGLIANIVRAFNLPLRKDSDAGLLTTESITGISIGKKRLERHTYSTVRPFVEIWFQRNVARTTTALGSNPTWNQELELNLSVPNDDFSQANLSKMDDFIYLLVYDEVAVDILEDDRRRDTDVHQRMEKRWLGSIAIPFSTLYTNGRIEGTFRLNTPHILLGYEAQGMAGQFWGPPVSGSTPPQPAQPSKEVVGSQKSAFVTIFITLQPSVQPVPPTKDTVSSSGETVEMMSFIKTWKNGFEKKFPNRSVGPLVMTVDGETILCTRYLKSIHPPEVFLNIEGEVLHVMEELAHYVSLFPAVRDSTLGITDYSLWFTSDVFIMTPGGGVEDHAVLLACYFTYLNVPCWILQGYAIPDGPATYVLTSFKGVDDVKGVPKSLKNASLIWNPCTGEYYNTNDSFCPLENIWAVIGKQNMWANISEGDRPYQLDWDIGKSNRWLPLFPKPISEEKIPCVQNGTIKYKTSDQNQANSLAQRIERHLKEVFMKWRKTSKTNWNRYCSATLRKLLPRLEENKSGRSRTGDAPGSGSIETAMSVQSGSVTSVNEEHLVELKEITTSYQMTGFPIHQPYINMESIIETVFATGVHSIDTPDVEFALAAYAHAYPASVYSVWIYMAALHRKKY